MESGGWGECGVGKVWWVVGVGCGRCRLWKVWVEICVGCGREEGGEVDNGDRDV